MDTNPIPLLKAVEAQALLLREQIAKQEAFVDRELENLKRLRDVLANLEAQENQLRQLAKGDA